MTMTQTTETTTVLSESDRALVSAWLSGAEGFTPDPTTEPYGLSGLRVAVMDILDDITPVHPRRYRKDLSEWWCDTCQTITDWCDRNA